ncbi:MAG: hypothetical protein H6Q74_1506 [Firmicutes bacterium]|nr:hypothetical protein [Bacillota bacterium]
MSPRHYWEEPVIEAWEKDIDYYDNRCSPTAVTAVAALGVLGIAALCQPTSYRYPYQCSPFYTQHACHPYRSCTPTYVYTCHPRNC